MKIKRKPTRLEKKARRGQRGYPVATIAFYGPDASRASKVAVGIVRTEDGWPTEMKRWFSDTGDVRQDAAIGDEVIAFIEEHGGRMFVLSPGIIGCPHEQGVDYPDGEVCPQCPYWANRDRLSGEELPVQ